MTREDVLRYMNDRHQHCQLEVMDIVTRERLVLATFDKVIEAPNWTKDGKTLIYNSEGRIHHFDIETRTDNVMDTGFATLCNNDHVLSPDNRHLAVSHMTEEDYASRIYILPIEGGTPRLVTQLGGSYLHGWSPDNSHLAFCGVRDHVYDIYTIRLDGTEETRLTFTDGLDDGPEYSPDGKKIWFNSTRSGRMQVWRMNPDGSNQEKMTDLTMNCWFPHISPDNTKVVYIAYKADEVAPMDHPADKNVQLRLMDADGNKDQPLVSFKGGQGTINVNSWSPDSRHIAYVTYE